VRERRMHSSVKAGRPTRAWAAVVRGWLPRGWVIEGQSPEVPDVANHGHPADAPKHRCQSHEFRLGPLVGAGAWAFESHSVAVS